MTKKLILKIFTNQTCSLCVTAKQALQTIQKQIPFELKEIDINAKGNEVWQKYVFDVPVIHVSYNINQKLIEEFLTMHRVDQLKDTEKLKEILAKAD